MAQQSEQNEHQIEAEVAGQMQVAGGFKDLLPAEAASTQSTEPAQPKQRAKIKTPAKSEAPATGGTATPSKQKKSEPQPKKEEQPQAPATVEAVQTADSASPANQQPTADEASSYLEKLAKENGIDLETASVEQLQQLMKQQEPQASAPGAPSVIPDSVQQAAEETSKPQPIEK